MFRFKSTFLLRCFGQLIQYELENAETTYWISIYCIDSDTVNKQACMMQAQQSVTDPGT